MGDVGAEVIEDEDVTNSDVTGGDVTGGAAAGSPAGVTVDLTGPEAGLVEEVSGELERLPGAGGWYVVRLPHGRPTVTASWGRRGFVPVTATVGSTSWETSLMPMGDGTHFLAVPAAVRRAEDLDEGDPVSARYRSRPDPRVATPAPAQRRSPARERW